MDNIEDKLNHIEEWNQERSRVKPYIDIAVEFHNKARAEARWKNYEHAARLYREAIENYRHAVKQNPKYYLQDLLDRIDHVIAEYIYNTFNLKIHGDNLKSERGIDDFVEFIDKLKDEEKRYIDPYDIAMAYMRIGDMYSGEGDPDRAYVFYKRIIDCDCGRNFVEHDTYIKMARILFTQGKFKEALIDFVTILSFDRENKEAGFYILQCLDRLGIAEHRKKFLSASPNEARKLIMEVL
jgi:tetratricopeptide (TPR) repeat protein